MNYKNILFVFLLISSFVFSQKKTLTQEEIKNLKENVKISSKKMNSLETDFIQIKHLDFMENDIKSTGKLYFKSGNIRWEYVSPFSYFIIFKGEKMHINDNGKKKEINISSNEMLKELNKVIAGSINGTNLFDESRFNLSYFKDKPGYFMILKPKDKAIEKYIKQIEITFGENFLVDKVKIIEPTLDYTFITFSKQNKNTDIKDEIFSF